MEHDNITPAEKALLFAMEEDLTGVNGLKVLVAGNRSGRLPCALAQAGADVTAHLFDCYHVQAMRTRLHEAGFDADAIIRCTAQIPEGPYDRAYFMTTPLSMTGELVLDQLEDIRANLTLGGQLFAAFEGDADEALKTMKKVFARVHVMAVAQNRKRRRGGKRTETVALLRAVKNERDVAAQRRNFAADWTASVPGGPTHTFVSLPGCFCHRRADLGGLSLAEVAAALSPSHLPTSSPSHPTWLMAGELVDTSRLFARNAAAIDPRWIESVAGALCRHHCHSPEWDPATGFVRATEQVTLYGLVIVPARRCDFSRFDMPKAREIFIRRGLVDGAIPHPPPPVRDNNALLDALRRLAEKTRRPELFDEERLFAHFDALLPQDVASAPALRKWLHAETPPRFRLRKNDWWPQASASSRDFPEKIRVGGVQMSLSYRHSPGSEETDGITCTVHKADAAALRLWRADWLVPGALPEKLLWMLSVLPSAQRRVLSPLADTVSGLMLHLKPGAEPLEDAVRHTIYAQWGIRIAPDAWTGQRIPPHLLVRFRIRDDATGNVIAETRDLAEALAKAGVARAAAPTPEAAAKYTAWDFGPLAEKVAGGQAGWRLEHYQALHDEGDGVTVRQYADPATAARVHAAGVTRLFLLALGDKARIPLRKRDLPPSAARQLAAMDYAPERLADDILAGAAKEVFVRGRKPVRDAEEFKRRLEEGRNARVETQVEIGRLAADALAAAAEASGRLELDGRIPADTAADISTQLTWLVCRGFPRYVPLARLRHFARYLKGVSVRMERAKNSPAADRERMERFAPCWQRYVDAATGKAKGRFDPDRLADYRWLLEEYRVSLFAQELRTPAPVSPKRLDAKWAEAMR
jgi:ATP-dependent helicase HrpA